MKSGMHSPILPIHDKMATDRGMMTRWCARGHWDLEAEDLSLPTLVLRSQVTGWAWPLAVVWWATTAKRGCYSASHVYKDMEKHFQCFHSQANHRGVQIFLLHFGEQRWILLCFRKQLWICVCQIVGVICYTCIISILLCCYYNFKELEIRVIYLPSYNTGLMDWTFSLLNLPVDMRTIIFCNYQCHRKVSFSLTIKHYLFLVARGQRSALSQEAFADSIILCEV